MESKLKKIVENSNFDGEIDNKCLKVFFENIIEDNNSFSNFYLSSYIFDNIKRYGKKELHEVMEHKLLMARFNGKGGWWHKNCTISHLNNLLENHLKKHNELNNIDICNFVMFIYFKSN